MEHHTRTRMSDQLGPDFDERLRAALERFRPPTPMPQRARFRRPQPTSYWLGGFKPALAAFGALAVLILMVAATAASGSPDPVVWTQRAVTTVEGTVETVTHVSESSPSPSPVRAPQPQSKPPAQAAPVKTAAPERDSSGPTTGSRSQPKESPEPSPAQSHDHHESPSPNSDESHRQSPTPPHSQN